MPNDNYEWASTAPLSPTTFIQWKGTDVCIDFTCPACGEHLHFDGYFAYELNCPSCEAIVQLGHRVALRVVMPEDACMDPIVRGTAE